MKTEITIRLDGDTLSIEELKAEPVTIKVRADSIESLAYEIGSAVTDYINGLDPETNSEPNMSKDRVLQILQDYVSTDADAAEPSYVRYILRDICGMTDEEIEEAGFTWLFPGTD